MGYHTTILSYEHKLHPTLTLLLNTTTTAVNLAMGSYSNGKK